MDYKLDKVNQFLSKKDENIKPVENNIILNGPDTLKNILFNETLKLNKLENVSNQLLDYLTDSKEMKRLSRKEQQSLLRDIVAIQTNSRDFIVKMAEMATKNEVVRQVIQLSKGPKEIVISENGEVFDSSITETDRRRLEDLLRTMLDDKTRG